MVRVIHVQLCEYIVLPAQMGDSFDIARDDLDRLLQYAEASAMRRQARSS
jgi:CBS-domain-containing membrane protein